MSDIYARCGASGQVIAQSDPCRVLLIHQGAYYKPLVATRHDNDYELFGISDCPVYYNGYWKSFSPFLRAVYDDYGTSTLVLDNNFERTQAASLFSEMYFDTPKTQKGENPYHEREVNLQAFIEEHAPGLFAKIPVGNTWGSKVVVLKDDTLDAELQACWTFLCMRIREQRLTHWDSSRGAPRPVSLFMVHELAYQKLVANTCQLKDLHGEPYSPAEVTVRALRKARDAGQAMQGQAEQEGHQDAKVIGRMAFQSELRDQYARLAVNSTYLGAAHRVIMDQAAEMVLEDRISEEQYAKAVKQPLTDLAAILSLEALDIRLRPVEYAGEDRNNRGGRAFARFVAEVEEEVSGQRAAQQEDD